MILNIDKRNAIATPTIIMIRMMAMPTQTKEDWERDSQSPFIFTRSVALEAIQDTERRSASSRRGADRSRRLSLLETLLATPGLSRGDVLTFLIDLLATGIDTVSCAFFLFPSVSYSFSNSLVVWLIVKRCWVVRVWSLNGIEVREFNGWGVSVMVCLSACVLI